MRLPPLVLVGEAGSVATVGSRKLATAATDFWFPDEALLAANTTA